ncbi:MAG: diguanylate cyclase [Hydrogenophaga sp.]|uniref:diguanylate cyclase domain-containing protein n=1 Tax=Hydrogenophaga sp. TaxID=1904254 RepID=UPI00276C16F5|nr:diguanylate cyclase [Hydrogenophaga sp.]MDP2416415.1 diguanylate cyclase [Hydrogenophaga sp.]MDZ4188505.1 diguanylate cyclase [Hydrogenophaga sp.]
MTLKLAFRWSRLVVWVSFIVALAVGVYQYVLAGYEREAQLTAQSNLTALAVAYNATVSMHQLGLEPRLRADVLTPPVLALWASASRAEPEELPLWRGRLYRLMAQPYQSLRADGLRQVQFHWPDGRSWLRMFAPSVSNDPLFEVRDSVRLANTRLVPVHGFEGGRVLPAFRHVYPVWHQGQHLGSVEISVPFEQVHQRLTELLPSADMQLLLDKRISTDMVAPEFRSHFVHSGLSDTYVSENPTISRVTRQFMASARSTELSTWLASQPALQAGLASRASFALPVLKDGLGTVASFHAIDDVQGLHAGYVVAYTPMPLLAQMWLSQRQQAWAGALGVLLLGAAMLTLRRQRHRLQREKQRLSVITEQMADGMYVMDNHGRALYVNRAACLALGYTEQELRGQEIHRLIHQHAQNGQLPLQDCPVYRTTRQGQMFVGEELFRRKDGTVFEAELRSMPLSYLGQRAPASVALFRDVTQRKQAEAQLRQAASVFEHVHEGICVTDERGNVVDANAAYARITGYERDEVLGRNLRMLTSGRHAPEFYQTMWDAVLSQGHWRGEIWNRHKAGHEYAAVLTVSAIKTIDGSVSSYVGILSDITALKLHEAELERIALYDALTGVPNRRLLQTRLEDALGRARRHGTRLALAYLDLDGFKAVNDVFGHGAGDHLLVEMSCRLSACLRETDTLARLGGDEFVLLLVDLSQDPEWQAVMQRVLDAVACPVPHGEHLLRVSCSLGVALYPDNNVGPDALMRYADQAMYQAKQAGKNRYVLFDPTSVNTLGL